MPPPEMKYFASARLLFSTLVKGCQHPRLNISHQQWSHWATREENWNRNLSRSDLIAHSILLVHISTKRTPPSMSRSRKWVHSTLSSMAKTGNWNRNSASQMHELKKVAVSVGCCIPRGKCRHLAHALISNQRLFDIADNFAFTPPGNTLWRRNS